MISSEEEMGGQKKKNQPKFKQSPDCVYEEANFSLDNMSPPQGGNQMSPVRTLSAILNRPTELFIKDDEENDTTEQKHAWVYYSLAASVLIALCNTSMSDLSKLGIEGTLYLAPGSMLCGLIYWSVFPLVKNLQKSPVESDLGTTGYEVLGDGPVDFPA